MIRKTFGILWVVIAARRRSAPSSPRWKSGLFLPRVACLVAAKQKNAQPVQKITIVPHTQGAVGYTMQQPEEEKFLMSKEDILTEIRTLVAGRAAERIVFGTETSGAANDIERATDIARKLVTMYGMSEKFGMVALATVQSQYLDGAAGMNCAQETAAAVDREVMAIISDCFSDSLKILEENRELLDKVADYLLVKETITGQEMMAILEGRDPSLVDSHAEKPALPRVIQMPRSMKDSNRPESGPSEPKDPTPQT